MALVALGLGTNLHNRLLNLRNATSLLKEAGVTIIRASDVFETEPWGVKDQPYFLNACLLAESDLSPQQLLALLKGIEIKTGRTETRRWGERIIDIDILLMDSMVFDDDEPDLHIPHRCMHQRGFVLIPLAQILPDWLHPLTKRTVAEMAREYPNAVRICSLRTA